MKLQKPDGKFDDIAEKRYLTHCTNIARIVADKNGWGQTNDRLKIYVQITGAELDCDKSS